MVYYTFTGNSDEITTLLSRDEIRGEEIKVSEVDDLTKLVILVTQRDVLSNEVYASGKMSGLAEQGAQSLFGDSYYSVKISVVIFEILKALLKIYLLQNAEVTFESIVELGYNIYANGIRKVDKDTYCVYKRLLNWVYKQKELKISYASFSKAACTSNCDTDMPKGDKCTFIDDNCENCRLTETELEKALRKLEHNDLIKCHIETIEVYI